MYGCLNEVQEKALIPFLQGRVVTDLGCGDCGWTRFILEQGASRVVAVDKENFVKKPDWWRGRPVKFVHQQFVDFHDPVDVAFVSWPLNSYSGTRGLIDIMDRAATVIYLGSNVSGNSCGSPQFFDNLLSREIKVYEPARSTLIVYGGRLPEGHKRKPYHEEWAGMELSTVYPFSDRIGSVA